MSAVIKECLKLAQKVSIPKGDELTARIESLDAEIGQVGQLEKSLLPLERPFAEQQIKRKKAQLNSQRRALINVQKNGRLSQAFSQLSLEPLGWRDAKGWPKLVLFGLGSSIFKLAIGVDWRDRWDRERRVYKPTSEPKLPAPLQACFNDVFAKLKEMAMKEKKSVALSTAWSGMLPAETRQAIVEAQKEFKHVFILAEPTGWELKKTAAPKPLRKTDPLVLGFDGEALWLVHRFNLTTLENYVASEFRV